MLPFHLRRVKEEVKVPIKTEVSPSNVTYQIPFCLPPVNSSSMSSNSSSPVGSFQDNSEEPFRVPFHLPVPGSSSSSASCSCGSDGSTLLRSNTALTLLQLGHLTGARSPLRSKLLDYSSPISSIGGWGNFDQESPFPVKSRIPSRFIIMEDDYVDDCTLYNDDSDAETLEDTEALLETDQLLDASTVVDADTVNLTEIARGIVDDSLDSTLDASELSLIVNSSVNTKQYKKNKKGIEQRYFDTVDKFGGPLLQMLTRFGQDGYKKERLFYIKLRGDKSEEKRFILNKCLVKVALKWRINKKGKDFGKPYQPSTWATKMKYLFSVFRQKNRLFNVQTDFNGEGEFHSILATQWGILMKNDDKFASGIGTSTFDGDADKKLRDMYKQGTFDPFSSKTTTEAYEDRKKYMVYVLGRYFLRRGKHEIAFTYWNQVKFKVTECEGERLEYVEVSHQWDKTHKCKLSNTRPRDATQSMPRIYSNANDVLCPH
jgi:hypothetical protein